MMSTPNKMSPTPHAYAPAEGRIDAGRFDRLMAHGCGRETNTHSSAVFVWVFVSVALLYLECPLTGLQDIGACVNKSVIIKGSLVTFIYRHSNTHTHTHTCAAQAC